MSEPLHISAGLLKYFPGLSELQLRQFGQLPGLYKSWNERINVISRKDIDQLFIRHILHSLSIAKVITFKDETKVIDIGTGGGFPGIPLAIFFPAVDFLLVDSTGKKITVVSEIANELKLENVTALKQRAEELDAETDFVLSRAVAPVGELIHWSRPLIQKGGYNDLKNGWLFLKGGDLSSEIKDAKVNAKEFEISSFFDEDFFMTKKVVYIKA